MDDRYKKMAIFAGGAAFGSLGIKLLTSKDAKKVYAHGTAAVLRVRDFMMKTVTKAQENVDDILASAKDINEEKALEEEMCECGSIETDSASKEASVVGLSEGDCGCSGSDED